MKMVGVYQRSHTDEGLYRGGKIMANIKEKDLPVAINVTDSDFLRIVTSGGASQMVPVSAIANDYIIEKGVSNSWYIRKWASGRFECWRRYDGGTVAFSSTGNIFYHDFAGADFPITFTGIPTIYISATTTGIWPGCYFGTTTSNTGTIRMYSSNNTSKSSIIGLYVCGNWQ